jgi:hypothetical protein
MISVEMRVRALGREDVVLKASRANRTECPPHDATKVRYSPASKDGRLVDLGASAMSDYLSHAYAPFMSVP